MLKHVLIQRALQEEAGHYWGRLKADPQAQVPDTYNMTGFLIPAGGSSDGLPAELRALPPGFHSLPRAQGGSLVLVEKDGNGHYLYLLFKQEQVDSLAFWFGVTPLAIVLVVIYIIAWSTYRTSKRAVSPVIWLAGQVQRWDPKQPEASALRPENLPVDVEGETLVLASSLHDFASRIGSFVERERDFTRDASHELRTPLTVIRVAGDMMAGDEDLSPMSRRSLKRIQGAGPRHGGADRGLPDPGPRRRHRPARRRLRGRRRDRGRSREGARAAGRQAGGAVVRQAGRLPAACAGARAVGAARATCCATPATTPTRAAWW